MCRNSRARRRNRSLYSELPQRKQPRCKIVPRDLVSRSCSYSKPPLRRFTKPRGRNPHNTSLCGRLRWTSAIKHFYATFYRSYEMPEGGGLFMSCSVRFIVRTMTVRCPYDDRTMSVRCPVHCPVYVRFIVRTMSVRCPYDVRFIVRTISGGGWARSFAK